MRRARLASLAVLLTLFLPLGLAACGGDDEDDRGGVPAEETDEGAPVDPEAGGGEEGGENIGGEAEE
jgi:hypothetical protein